MLPGKQPALSRSTGALLSTVRYDQVFNFGLAFPRPRMVGHPGFEFIQDPGVFGISIIRNIRTSVEWTRTRRSSRDGHFGLDVADTGHLGVALLACQMGLLNPPGCDD